MSAKTYAALEAALQTHINSEFEDQGQPLLTDWVLAAASVLMSDGIGDTRYNWWSSGTAHHHIVGLVTKLGGWIEEDDDEE